MFVLFPGLFQLNFLYFIKNLQLFNQFSTVRLAQLPFKLFIAGKFLFLLFFSIFCSLRNIMNSFCHLKTLLTTIMILSSWFAALSYDLFFTLACRCLIVWILVLLSLGVGWSEGCSILEVFRTKLIRTCMMEVHFIFG